MKHLMSMRLYSVLGVLAALSLASDEVLAACMDGTDSYSGTYDTGCGGDNTCWREKSSGWLAGLADGTPYGYPTWYVQCEIEYPQLPATDPPPQIAPQSRIEDFEFDPEAPAIAQLYEPIFTTFPQPAVQGTAGEPYDSMNHFRDRFATQSWLGALTPQSWNFGYRMQALAEMYETTRDTAYLDLLVYMGYRILVERDDHPSRVPEPDDLRGGSGLPGWGLTSADWGNTRAIFKEMSGLYVYPLLKFARMVYADPGLHTKYKQTADLFFQLGTESVTVYFADHPLSGHEYFFSERDQRNSHRRCKKHRRGHSRCIEAHRRHVHRHARDDDKPYLYFTEPSTMANLTCGTNTVCPLYRDYTDTQVPTNMAFLLGRAILEIWKVETRYPLLPNVDSASRFDAATGEDIAWVASTLVQYFQEFSRTTGSPPLRLWHYWDLPQCPNGSPCRLEDVSHGALVVDFLVQAHELRVPSVSYRGRYGSAAVDKNLLKQLGRTYSVRLDKLQEVEYNLAYDLNGIALSSSSSTDYRFYCGYYYILDKFRGNVHDNCEPLMTDRDNNWNDLGLAYYIGRKLELTP